MRFISVSYSQTHGPKAQEPRSVQYSVLAMEEINDLRVVQTSAQDVRRNEERWRFSFECLREKIHPEQWTGGK
jgi:hypothetical protein